MTDKVKITVADKPHPAVLKLARALLLLVAQTEAAKPDNTETEEPAA